VNGGVYAFLCGGGGKPVCPSAGGTVEGVITATDILAVPDQGIIAGDFSAAVRAIASGDTYANVHSAIFPAGEIRGQVYMMRNPHGANDQTDQDLENEEDQSQQP
jgi:hypothetical protein